MQLSRTDSGLTVAELGSDGAAVARALREHDPDLRLVPQPSDYHGCILWKVYRYAGGDRPAIPVVSWRTRDGEPLTLSMRLVDKVQELDRNTRGGTDDPDELNRQLVEDKRREAEQQAEDLADEYRKREGRIHVFPRSPSFAAARRRGRERGVTYDSPKLKRWSR